ncbi:MAG: hypothetical protein ACRES9_05270 [Gammaproteobacteria bacterium]
MNVSRIPHFTDRSRNGMAVWFSEMANRGLLFHPEDSPREIIRIATNEPLFTPDECDKLDGIMAEMSVEFGDGVCDAAYPVFMEAAGFPRLN